LASALAANARLARDLSAARQLADALRAQVATLREELAAEIESRGDAEAALERAHRSDGAANDQNERLLELEREVLRLRAAASEQVRVEGAFERLRELEESVKRQQLELLERKEVVQRREDAVEAREEALAGRPQSCDLSASVPSGDGAPTPHVADPSEAEPPDEAPPQAADGSSPPQTEPPPPPLHPPPETPPRPEELLREDLPPLDLPVPSPSPRERRPSKSEGRGGGEIVDEGALRVGLEAILVATKGEVTHAKESSLIGCLAATGSATLDALLLGEGGRILKWAVGSASAATRRAVLMTVSKVGGGYAFP
jgi:hypothetical protein